MRKKTVKVLTPVAACLAALVMLAAPAMAASSPYDIEAQRMRISVGSTDFDTPSASAQNCPGTTNISGNIDPDADPNDPTNGTIDGTINIESGDFVLPIPFSPSYRLTASGDSGIGTYDGNLDEFTALEFSNIDFTIKQINTSTCVTGTTVCSGTAALTATGGLLGTASIPLQTGGEVYVNASGSILTTSGCGLLWSTVITQNAPLTVGANPAYPNDIGAIFSQL